MAYWWVNQGQTFKEESQGGFLWAPQDTTKNLHHWNAVNDLQPGDVVFSHVRRRIVAIAFVTARPAIAPQPRKMAALNLWQGDGYLVEATYQHLPHPISVPEHRATLEPLMPTSYSPMTAAWTARQGYMFAIPPKLGTTLLQLGSLDTTHAPQEADEPDDVIATAILETGGTEAEALLKSRRGQGKYRADVIRAWGGRCSVTGLSNPTLLRASHVKPWAVSNDHERLDPHNGLLLVPNLDVAFDRGLITFQVDGRVRISRQLSSQDQQVLGLTNAMRLSMLRPQTNKYLEHHREHVFIP